MKFCIFKMTLDFKSVRIFQADCETFKGVLF